MRSAGRARRLGLLTDAAQRFERGVDPTLPALALERATALTQGDRRRRGGSLANHACRRFTASQAPEWVGLRRERLARLLGVAVPDEEVRSVMSAISDGVEPLPAGWRVRRPSHRFDVRIEEDLIEEVARLRGFDSIAESHAITPQVAGYATESQVSTDRLLSAMVDRGYREAITYSFVDPVVQHQLFPRHTGAWRWPIRSLRI